MEKVNSKFVTTTDLFDEIISEVKKAGKWPDFIEYALPDREVVTLYDYHFDPVFCLSSGTVEGYYIDLAIRGNYSLTDAFSIAHLGTIKTLEEGAEAIRKMAVLYGECLIAYHAVVERNLDRLTRKGFDIYFVTGNEIGYGLCGFSSIEEATNRAKQEISRNKKIKYAAIRDNLRKETLPRIQAEACKD